MHNPSHDPVGGSITRQARTGSNSDRHGLCSTSVQPPETTAQRFGSDPAAARRSHCDSHYQSRMHHAHQSERWSVIGAYERSGEGRWARRAGRMRECCYRPWLIVGAGGRVSLSLGRCRDRLCPFCARHRSRECSRKLAAYIETMARPRHIVLTLRSCSLPLKAQLDQLAEAWRRLRRHTDWKSHVSGGVYAIEVTRSDLREQWHPHLHVVYDGAYYPQDMLAAAWEQVTGDSRVVWVTAVHDGQRAAAYIAKYVTKGVEVDLADDDVIIELAEAMAGRRMLHAFGTCHNTNIGDLDANIQEKDEICSLSLSAIHREKTKGSATAIELCSLLQRAGGYVSYLLRGSSQSLSTPTLPLTEEERARIYPLTLQLQAEMGDSGGESSSKPSATIIDQPLLPYATPP